MVVFVSKVNSVPVLPDILSSLNISREIGVDLLSSSFLHKRGGVKRLILFLDVASYEYELKVEGSELIFDLVSVSVEEVRFT